MKLLQLVHEYAAILRWDGESALELMQHIGKLSMMAPSLLLAPLPFILKSFFHRVSLRFDLSRLDGEVLTVDKHGLAVVNAMGRLQVVQLSTLRAI